MAKSIRGTRQRLEGESLSFLVPGDWELWEPPPDMLFLASAPGETEPFEAQITVSKEALPAITDVKDYLVGNHAFMQSSLNAFHDLGSGVFPLVGTEVGWLKYSANIEGFEVSALDFFVVSGGKGYVVHCLAPRADFREWEELFQLVGRSIAVANDP